MSNSIYESLIMVTDSGNVFANEPMSKHTTFRIGGCADYYVTPDSITEAAEIVRLLLRDEIPFYIIGNGSNLLVSDKGYRGVILNFSEKMGNIDVYDNKIKAEAGAMLSKVAVAARDNSLEGLVFASGIPGSVGGAMVMNAGAYGGEMKDVVSEVSVLDMRNGEIVLLSGEEMHFGYRTSIIKEMPYAVMSAVFNLKQGEKERISSEMNELAVKRREKQPLEYPSAGSTFKRPEGFFAAKLIEDAGLKGYCVGDACVSEKHAGFVINKGNATAEDVKNLIDYIQSKVFERFEVQLEPEVCMLGFDAKD